MFFTEDWQSQSPGLLSFLVQDKIVVIKVLRGEYN